MLKNDSWIRRMAAEKGMIEPFAGDLVSAGVVSFGVSSYGYDMRLSRFFKVPIPDSNSVLDPKSAAAIEYDDVETACFALQPGCFVLARSLEYFRIPRDAMAIVTGKSTYARCGVVVNVTPLEPEWEGFVTISLSNTSPVPVRIYAEEGIAQVLFLGAASVCETSYADRKGKYQAPASIQTGRVYGSKPIDTP